ncbi:hypothetical protein COCMIDRAFT_31157 [Bipolaris oryzae ATCC 44560]|uniref:Uncharacterized protein n=1 Tax=Bipolaris oryzae ATCC 44560 TaxID=930090 RepID=W6YQJ9_COCMI|nr:uncharacterized protein COCMIDRAFT_31157 [Bipolaris oryzae ATCC 44560]EUC39768.1 hypothetical protein COCMIDRAFT_31157 [Bipolaris oryzae ATCC 44560]
MPHTELSFSESIKDDIASWSVASKCAIVNACWPHLHSLSHNFDEQEYSAFFEILGRILKNLSPARNFKIQNLNDLIKATDFLVANRQQTKGALVAEFIGQSGDAKEEDVVRMIELVARVQVGINICSQGMSTGRQTSRDTPVEWPPDKTLPEVIATFFENKKRRAISSDEIFDPSFTAAKLKGICHLHIRWTDNLVDHLKLDGRPGDRILSIYRHKLFLTNHRHLNSPNIIPTKVLDEAMRTLALLFPSGDSKTISLLKKEKIPDWSIVPSEISREMALDDFEYWRGDLARLLDLKRGPPETIAQTLLDTRDFSQFATLWIAILGVFLITVIFGTLSTVYAIKQYQMAVKSYDLSLATACQQLPQLPGFCPLNAPPI